MKNTLSDLNNHLFEALERLNDEELDQEELKKEIGRSKAISDVASIIIDNAKVQLDAIKFQADYISDRSIDKLPELLTYDKKS